MSSVGRRMTSLIFGGGGGGMSSPSTAHYNLNKNFQNFKCALRYSASSNDLFLLVEKNLQKFKINPEHTLTVVNQVNVEKLIYEEYLVKMPDSFRASVILQDASIAK